MTPPFETAEKLRAHPRICHGFFGRRSGQDIDLNMSENFGTPDAVAANYTAALNALGIPGAKLARLKQTHSDRVITITSRSDLTQRAEADGMVTDLPHIALSILTADCTPLLFADPQAGVIGACHAGWKGALSGIIANTIEAMLALGAAPFRIISAIGPTISGENYEVGPEFMKSLLAQDSAAKPYFFTPKGKTREHFDLPGYTAMQITRARLNPPTRIGGCTFAHADRYFSHRHASADLSAPGRQVALIALTK